MLEIFTDIYKEVFSYEVFSVTCFIFGHGKYCQCFMYVIVWFLLDTKFAQSFIADLKKKVEQFSTILILSYMFVT